MGRITAWESVPGSAFRFALSPSNVSQRRTDCSMGCGLGRFPGNERRWRGAKPNRRLRNRNRSRPEHTHKPAHILPRTKLKTRVTEGVVEVQGKLRVYLAMDFEVMISSTV